MAASSTVDLSSAPFDFTSFTPFAEEKSSSTLTDIEKEELLKNFLPQGFENFINANETSLKKCEELFQFKGMDIFVIAQKFAAIASKVSPEEINMDIGMIVVLLCERGTNFANFKEKMSKEGATRLNNIVRRYKIETRPKKDQGNSLTFSRIGHLFPELVCSYMVICKNPTVPYSRMTRYSKQFPKCMMAAPFSSLIPFGKSFGMTDDGLKYIVRAYMCHQIEFSKVVDVKSANKKKWKFTEWAEEAEKFARAGIDAQYLSLENRYKALDRLGIYSMRDTTLHPGVVEAAQTFQKIYDGTEQW